MFNLYLVYILSINSLYRFEISFRFILMLLNNPKVISAVLQNLKFQFNLSYNTSQKL